MPGYRLGNRVKETTTTEGTGDLTLEGAVDGFESFLDAVGDGNSTTFCTVEDSGDWEVAIGNFTESPGELTRDTLIASSTGSLIDWSAGTRDVFVTESAQSVLQATVIKTANYTALPSDSVILCDPASAFTITLPTAAIATLGIRYLIKKIDDSAYVVTIEDGGSANVDGATSSKLFIEGDYIELVCAYNGSGSEWFATGKYLKPHGAKIHAETEQTIEAEAWVELEFDTVDYQFGASANTASEYLLCNRTGLYSMWGQLSLSLDETARVYIAIAVVSGPSAWDADDIIGYHQHVGDEYNAIISMVTEEELTAGDRVHFLTWHDQMSDDATTNVALERQYARLGMSEII